MLFGILHYNFCYIPCNGKAGTVCISTFDIEPPMVRYYTKEELHELHKVWGFYNPLYITAVNYFPKETK
jgi:hypothetical protein